MNKEKKPGNEKILLVLLPFWTSLIPPLGISCLKSYLKKYNYNVKTVDATIETGFRDLYKQYFATIRENVPENQRGNFYSIGHDVLRDQTMAHLNYQNKKQYIRLVKELLYKTFYTQVDDREILKLIGIIDTFYSRLETYILDLLEKEKPAVLGISVYSDTLAPSLFAFKITREKYPHIKTMMGGGVFADLLQKESKNFEKFLEITVNYIDNIIIGEGEILLHKLLSGQLPESQRVFTLEDINNEILDLSSAEIPDFSDLPLEYYPYQANYTSRSCPFQCSFCSETIQWGKYRKKNPAQVKDEVTTLSKNRGRQVFLMSDSLLNPIITDLAREFIKTDKSIYWDGYLRVDPQVCESETVLSWRQGGFYRARLGIESGSPRVLKLMGKNMPVEQIKTAIVNLSYAGIKTTTYWVIGHPGETEADFQQTLNLVEELAPMIYEAECRPFYFFPTGQVNSYTRDQWWKNLKKVPLFPGQEDILLLQTWILDAEPSREETYRRVCRFTRHCQRLGIPNPYTLEEIHAADRRWKKLHKNAVPSLIDFTSEKTNIKENKKVKILNPSRKRKMDEQAWEF